MKKVLFLSHVPFNSNYGAATSTRQHLDILRNADVEFRLFQQTGLRYFNYKKHDDVQIKRLIANLDWLHDYNFGRDPNKRKLRYFITQTLKKVLEPLFLKRLRNFIIFDCIDIVHLNSPVLCGIGYRTFKKIPKALRPKLILHVRDVIKQNLSMAERQYFSIIDDFVCIDNSTLEAVYKNLWLENGQRVHLQGNPFTRDLNNVKKIFAQKTTVQKNILNIAIVGALIEDKGVLDLCKFVLESVHSVRLFIVGDGDLRQEVLKLAQRSNGKIHYLGETEDLYHTDFYESIDILFRADLSFRVGRTVFEAIYCGCNVALPFTGSKIDVSLGELTRFRNAVHLWQRSADGFEQIISQFKLRKIDRCRLVYDPTQYRIFFQRLYS